MAGYSGVGKTVKFLAGDFPCPDLVHQLPDSLQFVRNRESAAAAAAGRDGHPTAVGRRLVFSARSPQNGVVTRTPRFDLRRGVVESVVLMISRSQQPTRVLVSMVDAPWMTCGGRLPMRLNALPSRLYLRFQMYPLGSTPEPRGFVCPGQPTGRHRHHLRHPGWRIGHAVIGRGWPRPWGWDHARNRSGIQ